MVPSTRAETSSEISRLEEENHRLRSLNLLLHSILDNSPFLISTKDLNGNITMASRHFEKLESPEPAALIGKNVFDVFPQGIAEQLWRNDQLAARDDKPVSVEEVVKHKDGTTHTYLTVKFPTHDEHGILTGTCAVSMDNTELKQATSDSITDALTALKNRRYFDRRFPEEHLRAKRAGLCFHLILSDIDHFKSYNDSYGHGQGDTVLIAVARSIEKITKRAGDLVFR